MPLESPSAGPVCEGCWTTIERLAPPWCARCGDAVVNGMAAGLCRRCERTPYCFETARSAGAFDGVLRGLIHQFKYGSVRSLATPLSSLMREAGTDLIGAADAVVPVPLHPWRSFQRGFNQADDLARGLGLPVWRVLRRRRHGVPQASLPAERRHSNVGGAFGLRRRGGPGARLQMVRERTLLLVDDVMTTGATLDACGEVLLEAGARRVLALTAARAVAGQRLPPRPPRPLATAPRR
jgi:ComF family protein